MQACIRLFKVECMNLIDHLASTIWDSMMRAFVKWNRDQIWQLMADGATEVRKPIMSVYCLSEMGIHICSLYNIQTTAQLN